MNKKEYLLVKLIEELSEVQQAVSKALEFSLEDLYEGKSNLQYIREELSDVEIVIQLLFEEGFDVTQGDTEYTLYSEDKIKKIGKWMEYAKEKGCLESV